MLGKRPSSSISSDDEEDSSCSVDRGVEVLAERVAMMDTSPAPSETAPSNDRWRDIRCLTEDASFFANPAFEPGEGNLDCIRDCQILVVGAGGLGCELLKNLALSGFTKIHVIDMDTIDLTNLNRQFLFRVSDIGKSKAFCAAKFIEQRVKGCSVTPHNAKIQDMPPSFYSQFHLVICGLDSIVARRWLNAMLCDMVQTDDDGNAVANLIPLIDGGTEGFKGNARVILPRMTACIECTLDLYPPQVNFPLCTIAHTPRLPEHCVEYVKVLEWEKLRPFNGDPLDADLPEHVRWVYQRAADRAKVFGIMGVDIRLTQGVLKRIIPAVASTNAVIAAACALEALKAASNISNLIKNYLTFTQTDGAFFNVTEMERSPDCIACSGKKASISFRPNSKFRVLYDKLVDKYQLKNPTFRSSTGPLYMVSDLNPEMKEPSAANLERPLSEVLDDGDELLIADETLRGAITLIIRLDLSEPGA